MASPTQKLNNPRRGEHVTAARETSLITQLRRMIVAGRGILVKSAGDQVIIEAKPGIGGTGGKSSGAFTWMKTATTKAGLEEPVNEIWFGRVTAGDDKGMVCVRNPDNDGWDAINFFE